MGVLRGGEGGWGPSGRSPPSWRRECCERRHKRVGTGDVSWGPGMMESARRGGGQVRAVG